MKKKLFTFVASMTIIISVGLPVNLGLQGPVTIGPITIDELPSVY